MLDAFINDLPQNIPNEVIIVRASQFSSPQDKLNQKAIIINISQALNKSISGGIGETLSGISGIRSTFYGPNASRPIIRGLGEDRIRILTNGLQGIDASTISPDHSPAIDGLEAQSIEVIKGASALRFGSNALAGVVNIIDGRLPTEINKTVKSADIFTGYNSVSDAKSISGNVTNSFNDYIFRIDGFARKSSDYKIPKYSQTKTLRLETGDTQKGFIPNSGASIWAFGASVAKIKDNYNIALSARDTFSEYGIPNEDAHIELKQKKIDLSTALKLNSLIKEISLTSSYGDYTHSEIENTGDIGTIFNSKGFNSRIEFRQKKYNNFDGLIGIQVAKKDFEAIGEEAFIPPVDIENNGIFIIQKYDNGKYNAEFGYRIDAANYKSIAGNRKFDAPSASISASFKPIPELKISAHLAQTTRIPTETELFANGPHAATGSFEIGNLDLKNEIANSYELSSKLNIKNNNIEMNLWGVKFDRFISFNPTGQLQDDLPVYSVVQKDALLQGFELEVQNYLGEWHNIEMSSNIGIDYIKGEYKDGDKIPRIPPLSVSLGLSAKLKEILIKLELLHLEKQNSVAQFETVTSSSSAINLGINYTPEKFDNIEMQFNINNLTNEEIREHTSVLKDYLPKPKRGITFGIRYKY